MKNNIPQSIGVIMDGNRRYAREKKVAQHEGHYAGYLKSREIRKWAMEAGVKEMILFAFSTENWNRAEEEVRYLMTLFHTAIGIMTKEALEENVRLSFIGERAMLSPDMVREIEDAEEKTKGNDAFHFCIALSYGGRAEIIDAIRRIPKEKCATISEDEFAALLWTRALRDPDLIIRTSGEMRLSGFLTWQTVYSELYFTKTLWPEFTKDEFMEILKNYASRERRSGK
jgi:undecaprenyl diphosphate synthase